MRRLASLAFAAVPLTSCAHVPSSQPVFACAAEIESPAGSASANRLLDGSGRQLSVVGSWTHRDRGFAIAASWFGSAADPDPAKQSVSFLFDRRGDDELGWLGWVELRTGSATTPAHAAELIGGPHDPGLSPSWITVRRLLASELPLYLVQLGAGGELLRSEAIDRTIFPAALRNVRAALERSRAMTADPRRNCSPYGKQQIVI